MTVIVKTTEHNTVGSKYGQDGYEQTGSNGGQFFRGNIMVARTVHFKQDHRGYMQQRTHRKCKDGLLPRGGDGDGICQ